MKNVKPYTEDTFLFHKEVISKKKNTKKNKYFKERVSRHNDDIEICFRKYDNQFDNNTLQDLIQFGYAGIKKKTFLQLYSFNAKIFQKLKIKLTTKDGNIVDNICQNCTISEINSFDHVVPKDEFPEFVVNPKNLFPSCTNCNSRKGTTWREDGRCVFLNLYTDILPNEQYLFVKIEIDNNELKLTYSVKNINNIDTELYNLIDTHYDKLNLLERFENNSDIVVSELENEINEYKDKVSLTDIKDIIVKKCNKDKELLGSNYWKSILRLALINDDAYMRRFN